MRPRSRVEIYFGTEPEDELRRRVWHFQDWMLLAMDYPDRTAANYAITVRRFERWRGERPITDALLAEYLAAERAVSVNRENEARTCLKKWLYWLVREGFLSESERPQLPHKRRGRAPWKNRPAE